MQLPITTHRLYINEFNRNMAENFHKNSLDEDNRRFVPDEVFETVDAARKTLTWLISCYVKKDAPLVYPVFLNDGENIGYVQAVPIPDGWEIGYHIAKTFTGNGYATEAVNAFLPCVMRHLGITKIFGICHAENIASRKVLEKCGFILEYEGAGQYFGQEQPVCRYKYIAIHETMDTHQNMQDYI